MNILVNNEDIVQQIIGNFGRWQLRTIVLVFLCKIPTAWFMACIIYTAPTPQKGDFYCRPKSSSLLKNNETSNNIESTWIRMSDPSLKDVQRTDREFQVNVCHMYERSLEKNFKFTHGSNYTNPFHEPLKNQSNNIIVPCDHLVLNSDYKSLVMQFDLVCSRQLLVSLTQSLHGLGALMGGLIAVIALKYISPRHLMLYGMLGQIVCGNLTGLVSTFTLHVYYRCLTSMFCAFMSAGGQYILSDITNGKARTIVITLSELFWSIGLILLPGISIFFDSWSHLYVAISSSLTILVILHRWISDSPLWLLKHQQIDATLKLLLESAAFNNREIPLDLEDQLLIYMEKLRNIETVKYSSIWHNKGTLKYVISIHWAWSTAIVLYNVMILMTRSLGVTHIHVKTACLGFAEMLGVFLGLYLILYTRHRWLWSGYLMSAAGLITYFIWLVPNSLKESRRVGLDMIFWIILKLANSAVLSVLSTCSGELVSLEQRPLLMLSTTTFSRFWLIVAPFISILIKIHYLIPITIFATLALSSGVLMCFLNVKFWNDEQCKIPKIPTPNTYRRKSSTILLKRRNSSITALNTNAIVQGFNNPLTVSISDLWHLDQMFNNQEENGFTNDIKNDVSLREEEHLEEIEKF